MVGKIKFALKKIKVSILNFYKKPNKNAVWVFGFQKSGTSAIASLFAKMAGKTATIDSIYLWQPYKFEMDKNGIAKHVNKYSLDFSRDIIKEPGATFYMPTIDSYFNLDKYIFITRNPYDNIRSILNRLNVPGNKENINLNDINFRWRHKFSNGGKNYVKDLAELWEKANNNQKYMYDKRCVLVKYEDFRENKIKFIESLLNDFDFEIQNDIADIKDKPFQPKGDANVDIIDFFGLNNIKVINQICGETMLKLGYSKL